MVEGKIYAIDETVHMKVDHWMRVSLTDTTLSVHGIMRFLMLETGKYQYGLQILNSYTVRVDETTVS